MAYGDPIDCKSSVAEKLFSNDESSYKNIRGLYNLYYRLKDVNMTKGVIFTFHATFSGLNMGYLMPYMNCKII